MNKRHLPFLAVFLLTTVGTYNAVVINSHSEIESHDMRFVRRLDEVYGVITPGRTVAAVSTEWKKLPIPRHKKIVTPAVEEQVTASTQNSAPAEESEATGAHISADLNLNLTEVVNSKKWEKGIAADQFSGSLSANNGTIENLSVSLPNGEGISVSFSEMSGNVFEYSADGENYSGMLYQVDQNNYMVTLTNGPLEGTRMRFSQGEAQEVTQPQDDTQMQAEAVAQGAQDLQGASFQF